MAILPLRGEEFGTFKLKLGVSVAMLRLRDVECRDVFDKECPFSLTLLSLQIEQRLDELDLSLQKTPSMGEGSLQRCKHESQNAQFF